MTTIVTRAGKGSALTWTEGDANFTNLNNAKIENVVEDLTPQLGGDLDVNGKAIVSTSNGNINITPAGTGNINLTPVTGHVTISATNFPTGAGSSGQVLTTNGAGQASWSTPSSGITDIVQDTSPQLGGDLDVNGKTITSVSNGNVSIVPNGSGNILLTPASGKVTISATNFPTGAGTNGQYLKTDGAGQASWASVTDTNTTYAVSAEAHVTSGANIRLTGSDATTDDVRLYNDGSGVTVTRTDASSIALGLSAVLISSGSFTNANITVDNYGRITAVSNGSAGSGTVTSVGGTGTVNGLTLTGTVTTSGNLTLGGTLDLSAPPAIGATTPAAITGTKLSLPSTAISAAAWTTAGIGIAAPVRTYTDTSSSGTVASNYIHSLTGATIASTNTTTVTNAATLFLGAPGAGTNTTLTNTWALLTTGSVRVGRIYQQRSATQANWGTLGAQFTIDAATLTNSTSSGTVAAMYVNTFNAPTIAATNVTTVTDNANLYVANPVASTNMTFTNNWGILTDGAIKSAGLTSTGALTLNAANELRLADSDSSNYVGFKSPATVSANKIWTLPSADGTANQVLKTDGAGVLGWATAGGATVAWISQDSIKGTLITGSTYRQTISEVSDPSGIITVTSNQFTVAAGTYMVEFIGVNKCTTVGAVFQHALYNVTGAVNIDNYIGVLLSDGTSATRYVHQWVAVITPASSNTYEFRCLLDATTNTVTNPGGAAGFRITKIG